MCEIYISVHDQDLILQCEKNRLFRNLKNYKYLFLGMRPVDKLGEIMDKVIVVRDLPINIEDKKCLCDYTGHYALAKNEGLVKSKYVIIIHYDCFVKRNFLPSIKATFKINQNSFINFQPCKLTREDFLSEKWAKAIIEGCKAVYNMDIIQKNKDFIQRGDIYWQAGGSFACSFDNLQKYIDWMEPLIPYIEADPMGPFNTERAVKFFCNEYHLHEVFFSDIMEHIFNSSHDFEYHTEKGAIRSKQRFEKFMCGELFKEQRQLIFKKFIYNVFSLVNIKDHKVLTIFGVKFKFRRRNRRK